MFVWIFVKLIREDIKNQKDWKDYKDDLFNFHLLKQAIDVPPEGMTNQYKKMCCHGVQRDIFVK